jgi:hypothetical protein
VPIDVEQALHEDLRAEWKALLAAPAERERERERERGREGEREGEREI